MSEAEQYRAAGFPIVAIGASAGGLEPLEQFFEEIPVASGIAFVVVQHLAPDFRSMMNELLARHSDMPIHKVETGMVIEPNAIYLNPPRHDMTLENGRFKLQPSSVTGGVLLPIDAFFTSLAAECGRSAIGIVLSGTGSDGSLGCEAVKTAGGLVLVQEPAGAKFINMPLAVIKREIADGIADPEVLAQYVIAYANGEDPSTFGKRQYMRMQDPLAMIVHVLREKFGTNFGDYKRATLERRIKRRCDTHGIRDLTGYLDKLTTDKEEAPKLYDDLLIDVTAFFRDPEAYRSLEETVLSGLAGKMSSQRPVRIWVPGCSTGEEAYSIAIQIAETARKIDKDLNVKILATDAHAGSIHTAAAGLYPDSRMEGLPEDIVERYFFKDGAGYRIKPFIRRLVVFSQQDVLVDPPFTRIDLLSCRNLLIYINELAQKKVLTLFHHALTKEGYLFLGPSETIGRLDKEFRLLSQRWRIFQKIRDVRLVNTSTLLSQSSLTGPERFSSKSTFAQFDRQNDKPDTTRAYKEALQELLSRYAPAGFLVTTDGSLVHVFGDAARWLTMGEGSFSASITSLLPDHIRLLVGSGLDQVKTTGFPSFRRKMVYERGGHPFECTVTIESLPDADGCVDHLLLTITEEDAGTLGAETEWPEPVASGEETGFLRARVKELESDLRSTEESLQTTIEELETSNEELQATNEELMASNEELQSTNEELHSVNEELFSVGAEHQQKIEQLIESNNDMDHLLKATGFGTVFLDVDLRIRRFTPAATKGFNLLPQDLGRSITHVTFRFDRPDFVVALSAVVESGNGFDEEVMVGDHHYLLRVLPYTDDHSATQGVVIALIDIHELNERKLELEALNRKLDKQRREFEDLYKRTPVMMQSVDQQGTIIEISDAWLEELGYRRDEVIGHPKTEFVSPEARGKFERDFAALWDSGTATNTPYPFVRKNGSMVDVELSAIIDRTEGREERSLAVLTDVSDRNTAFRALERSNADLEKANESLKKFTYIASHDLQEPLRKIQQFGDMLLAEYANQVDDEARFYIGVMQNAATRMRRLIRDLLAFSRASNAQISLETTDLTVVAQRAAAELAPMAMDAKAKIFIRDLPSVQADETLVEQMFLNLISNAVKYRRAETGPVIEITSGIKDGVDVVCVADNGIGIPTEHLDRIFEPFSRVHRSEAVDGSGLGLSICRTICDRLGWSIQVVSQPGTGSTFTIGLPGSSALRTSEPGI